jgi:hypothetical protein
MARATRIGLSACALVLGLARSASADEPQPLPPPAPPPPTSPAAPTAEPAAPPTAPVSPSSEPPPTITIQVKPAAPPPEQKLAVWLGGRAGVLAFGNAFYTNQHGLDETTGNFVKTGLGLEVDAGVRLFKRFTPYVFWEHGIHGVGRRFEGGPGHAWSNFFGAGFRYLAGNIDELGFGFLTDVSIGMRTLGVSDGTSDFSMRALEIFRLGLGAEIRLSPLLSLTPLATISGGVMRSTDGNVRFSPAGSADGIVEPTFHDGKNIDAETTYLVLGLGLGAHFDLFAR